MHVNINPKWAAAALEAGDKVSVDGKVGVVHEQSLLSEDVIRIEIDGDVSVYDFSDVRVVLDVEVREIDSFMMKCTDKYKIPYFDVPRVSYILSGSDIPTWLTLVVHRTAENYVTGYVSDTWAVSCYQSGHNIVDSCKDMGGAIFEALRRIKRLSSPIEHYNERLMQLAAA